jgi:hypothetical protein
MSNKSKKDIIEVPEYFWKYINLVEEDDLMIALKNQRNSMMNLLLSIPANKELYAYAEGKWTVKELALHINDTERIFAYRALRFMRGDETPLAGFEENDYATNSLASERSLTNIADEFFSIRNATIHLFESMPESIMKKTGVASGKTISVGALAFCICGHPIHHINILRERYGIK